MQYTYQHSKFKYFIFLLVSLNDLLSGKVKEEKEFSLNPKNGPQLQPQPQRRRKCTENSDPPTANLQHHIKGD